MFFDIFTWPLFYALKWRYYHLDPMKKSLHQFTHAERVRAAKTVNDRLTPKQRSAAARKAVNARWAKAAAEKANAAA